MDYPHRREYFRVQYPTVARPRLELAGKSYAVIDISERGLRYRVGDSEPEAGTEFTGLVHFKQGDMVDVRGTVLRVVDGQVSCALSVGVPFKVIIDEQRYLNEHHRGLAW
jgi:PilZ domain-containing protein